MLTYTELAALSLGTRLVFAEDYDIYPHARVRAGTRGEVTDNTLADDSQPRLHRAAARRPRAARDAARMGRLHHPHPAQGRHADAGRLAAGTRERLGPWLTPISCCNICAMVGF